MSLKCKKCGVALEEYEPQQNGMCIDCFAADWGELVEISPMVSPKRDIEKGREKQ